MNVFANDAALNDVRSQYETLAQMSAYDLSVDDMTGYDNPMIDDVVGFSHVKDLSAAVDDRYAYEPLHDDRPCYTSPSNDIIGHNNSQEPPADNKYLVLLDDEGKLGNASEVPPQNVNKNTQETPADTKYLVLLDDEGKLGNASEFPPPCEDNNTQETPADTMYLELLDDDDNTPEVPCPRDDIDRHHASLV